MATHNYQTYISHASDAEFRIWGSAFKAALAAAGLVQTADTGQINWATAVRPGVSFTNDAAAAGYEMYRFNDALQATFPVFIKIEYGTGSVVAAPMIYVSVGTSTNGAGTLGSVKTNRYMTCSRPGLASTSTAYHTYICHKDGFLGVLFKLGASATSPAGLGAFCIGRTVNDDGTENGDGIWLAHRMMNEGGAASYGGMQLEILRVATNVKVTSPDAYNNPNTPFNYCLVPGGPSTSAVSADFQAYKWYVTMPRVRPLMQVCTIIHAEFSIGATFMTNLVGATPRTYLATGGHFAYTSSLSLGTVPSNGANHAMAMLYE